MTEDEEKLFFFERQDEFEQRKEEKVRRNEVIKLFFSRNFIWRYFFLPFPGAGVAAEAAEEDVDQENHSEKEGSSQRRLRAARSQGQEHIKWSLPGVQI